MMGNYLGAHSDWSGADMVHVSANLDVGKTLRQKIHPLRPRGRISHRSGGSIISLSVLCNYRMRTPRPRCCWMMFAKGRCDEMDWGYDREGGRQLVRARSKLFRACNIW